MKSKFDHIDIVDDRVAEILSRKTDGERLANVDQMWRFARGMIRANLRREHPTWTEQEIDRATAKRLAHAAE